MLFALSERGGVPKCASEIPPRRTRFACPSGLSHPWGSARMAARSWFTPQPKAMPSNSCHCTPKRSPSIRGASAIPSKASHWYRIHRPRWRELHTLHATVPDIPGECRGDFTTQPAPSTQNKMGGIRQKGHGVVGASTIYFLSQDWRRVSLPARQRVYAIPRVFSCQELNWALILWCSSGFSSR